MNIPVVMNAVVIEDGAIGMGLRPVPKPGYGELLVRVRAAGLNNADLLQTAGHYPAPDGWPQDIPGLELAGEVAALGDGCERFRVGDRICAVVGGGAQAEYAIVPELVAMSLRPSINWAQAGAFPEAAATAWDALVTQGALDMFERLLVTGAAGGVGTMAVQLGVARGAKVIASCRATHHDEALHELGAAKVVRPEQVGDHGPYDVALELVGGADLPDHVRMMSMHGRIVVIGVGSGRKVELDLLAMMQRRVVLRGSTLRARPQAEHADIARTLEQDVLPLLDSEQIQVPIWRRFDLDAVVEAHAAFARGGKLGKLVLTL